VLLSSGCEQLFPTAPATNTPPASTAAQVQPQSKNPTAVESAIAISDKYAKLSEEAAALKQRKDALEAENQKLKDDLRAARENLEKAQKELTEVNDLLVQMRLELNNWKSDVLGFRNEMRDAEKAQIEALLKILRLLGGEINASAESNQPVTEVKK
jgi:chromosome segregation ATPase